MEQTTKTKPEMASEKVKTVKGFLTGFKKLDVKKKIQYVAILLVIIIMLAIYFASSADNSAPSAPAQPSSQAAVVTSADSVEQKLKQTLQNIKGAGRVEVMITYTSSAEIVPAISVDTQVSTTTDASEDGNSTTSTENTQREIVTVGGQSGNTALVLREESPVVKGVLVIAEGADDIGVRLNLLSAVQTILNVGPDQVDVYKMNNE